MRTPAMLGDLLPIAVPGFLVVGALSVLVRPTVIGDLAFTGSWVFLIMGVATGTLVLGYLLAGLQEALSTRVSAFALPPASHLDWSEHAVVLPAPAVERAGYRCGEGGVVVPLGTAYALERALSGAWGTPEGAGWDRVAYLQRIAMALGLSALLGLGFLAVGLATGSLNPGIRSHGGAVLLLGALSSWLVALKASRSRSEAVLDLLADARALLLDRGEQTEVRRCLNEIGIELTEEGMGLNVAR